MVWIETKANSREIVITNRGKTGFKDFFGLDKSDLDFPVS